jgi:hypothetical protein
MFQFGNGVNVIIWKWVNLEIWKLVNVLIWKCGNLPVGLWRRNGVNLVICLSVYGGEMGKFGNVVICLSAFGGETG